MSAISEDVKKYELMAIIDPDIGSASIKAQIQKLQKYVDGHNGKVFYQDEWGLKNLAYPIRKKEHGYYIIFDFEFEPRHIREFDRMLKLDVEILRHMLMALPVYYEPKDYSIVEEVIEEEAVSSKKKPTLYAKKTYAIEQKSGIEAAKTTKKTEPAVVVEKQQEPAVKPVAPKKEESLEDIDKKLDKLLDNPDIQL